MDTIGGASSRSHEGRGRQLNCTPDAQPTIPHWERGLSPGRIVKVASDAHDGSEPVII